MTDFEQIGVIKSEFTEPVGPEEMQQQESTIVINPEYEPGLYKIEDVDYLQVIFNLHDAEGYTLQGPRRHGEERGVFASRSPKRPNSIGVTTVKLLDRNDNKLVVTGLDAIDGTPVLDLKPYAAMMDQVDRFSKDELKDNPRANLEQQIANNDLENLLVKAGELHGHFCPYLSLGVQVAQYALTKLDVKSQGMEELVAIVETNSCFSDGIQYITGCTFGNNALIYKDYGKTAVTIANRQGKGLRLYLTENDFIEENYPQVQELFKKVIVNRKGSNQEQQELNQKWRTIAFELLEVSVEELFKIEEVQVDIPEYAPIFEDKYCSQCGEKIMAAKAEQGLCIPCSEGDYLQLDGRGLNIIDN